MQPQKKTDTWNKLSDSFIQENHIYQICIFHYDPKNIGS